MSKRRRLEEGKEKKLQQKMALLRYVRKVILQNNLDVSLLDISGKNY
jgi:hypothetical protein